MKEPKKPVKPSKPQEPLKVISESYSVPMNYDNEGKSLAQIIEDNFLNADLSQVFLRDHWDHDDSTMYSLDYTFDGPNRYYESDLKKFNNKMVKYQEKLEKYNVDYQEYKSLLKQYREFEKVEMEREEKEIYEALKEKYGKD